MIEACQVGVYAADATSILIEGSVIESVGVPIMLMVRSHPTPSCCATRSDRGCAGMRRVHHHLVVLRRQSRSSVGPDPDAAGLRKYFCACLQHHRRHCHQRRIVHGQRGQLGLQEMETQPSHRMCAPPFPPRPSDDEAHCKTGTQGPTVPATLAAQSLFEEATTRPTRTAPPCWRPRSTA